MNYPLLIVGIIKSLVTGVLMVFVAGAALGTDMSGSEVTTVLVGASFISLVLFIVSVPYVTEAIKQHGVDKHTEQSRPLTGAELLAQVEYEVEDFSNRQQALTLKQMLDEEQFAFFSKHSDRTHTLNTRKLDNSKRLLVRYTSDGKTEESYNTD